MDDSWVRRMPKLFFNVAGSGAKLLVGDPLRFSPNRLQNLLFFGNWIGALSFRMRIRWRV